MTGNELISHVIGALDPGAPAPYGLFRGGRLLIAFPERAEAALATLRLYQPQRMLARLVVVLTRRLIRVRLARHLLRRLDVPAGAVTAHPSFPPIEGGTCGVLLGSPEHRIRRAVASFRSGGEWQVAKIAFGAAGRNVIEGEAAVIGSLRQGTPGVPHIHGIHHAGEMTILRMPYIEGRVVRQGESEQAIQLLEAWISTSDSRPIASYDEWPSIEAALGDRPGGRDALRHFVGIGLVPAVRHGDFARWNLIRRDDGGLTAIDWEWGSPVGMPGLDLAHYVLQDSILVSRKKPANALDEVLARLGAGACDRYLRRTGWTSGPLLPVITNLAYKMGTGQQDTGRFLDAAIGKL